VNKIHEAQKKKSNPAVGDFFTKKCWKSHVKQRVKQRVRLKGTQIMNNSSLINDSIMMRLGTIPLFWYAD